MTPEPQEAPIPQAVRYQAIRDSFNRALPYITSGREVETPLVWNPEGELDTWDRPPTNELVLPLCSDILATVADISGVSANELLGDRKQRRVAQPRHILCYLIHELRPGLSLPRIGQFIGGRDHTTIMHSNKVVRGLLADGDPATVELYRECKMRLLAVRT